MRIPCLAALTFLFAFRALAQFDSGTVLGLVADPREAAVSGGRVELKNIATGLSASTLTDDAGQYRFINMPIGRYDLSVTSDGFRAARSQPFDLVVGARQRVDFRLELQSVESTVEVRAEAALVETDSSERGQIVDRTQIVELPLNGREYSRLVYLSAGSVPSPSGTGSSYSSREGSFNANGLRSVFNNYLLDGLDNNYYGTSNQGFSNQVVQPAPDSIAEFKVVTNNMSAEYGRSAGATVNASMRSGTNKLHGSIWEFVRNTDLNAVGFFKPAGGKPALHRNQFGAAAGGPAVRNRIFFFGDYDGYRESSSFVDYATLPAAGQRAGIVGYPVLNPLTQKVYANGVIPEADMIPFAKAVLAALPPNTNSNAVNNFETLHKIANDRDKGDGKADFVFHDRLRGFARYSQSRADIFDPGTIPGVAGGDGNGNTRIPILQTAAGLTWTVNARSMLEARFSFSRARSGKTPVLAGGPGMRDLFGITGLPEDKRYTGGITYQGFIGGFTSLGRQWTNPQYQYPSTWNPKVNYSRIQGRHTIKAGVEHQRVHVEQMDIHPVYGIDAYAGQLTGRFLPTYNPSDARQIQIYSYTDFLFGLRAQILQSSPAIANIRQWMWFGYLQDDFKVSRRLTLNLGLRYEFATPVHERDNRLSNYDPATKSLLVAKSGSLSDRTLVDPDKNNFGPRIGMAYALTPKTALRGGYGISYVHWNRVGSSYLTQNAPFAIVAQRLTLPGTALYRNTQDGYPAGLVDPAKYNPTEVTLQYAPRNTPSGKVQSWFFSIQREVARDLVVDLAYVGNRGDNLVLINDLNQAAPNAPGQSLSVQARRPNPQFATIAGSLPYGYSNYNGLQVKVEKRFSAGYYLLNSFTWSKAIDLAGQPLDGGGGCDNCGNNIPSVQDIHNLDADRGLSAYDRPFVNSTSLVWELPGKGLLLGGWQLSAINQMRSGPTLTLAYDPSSAQEVSPLITVYGRNAYRPNISADPVQPDGARSYLNYFNRSAVSIPAADKPFGNAGRSIARGFAFYQLDLGLFKTFSFSERWKLQFRAEAFNLLNRTNFREPNANASSVAFGTVSATFDPRQLQFALKVGF